MSDVYTVQLRITRKVHLMALSWSNEGGLHDCLTCSFLDKLHAQMTDLQKKRP